MGVNDVAAIRAFLKSREGNTETGFHLGSLESNPFDSILS
jgi:hypothetical protein